MEGGKDPFVAGEAAALAAALELAGIEHELRIVPDMPHGFLQLFGLQGCTEGWRRVIEFLRGCPRPEDGRSA